MDAARCGISHTGGRSADVRQIHWIPSVSPEHSNVWMTASTEDGNPRGKTCKGLFYFWKQCLQRQASIREEALQRF